MSNRLPFRIASHAFQKGRAEKAEALSEFPRFAEFSFKFLVAVPGVSFVPISLGGGETLRKVAKVTALEPDVIVPFLNCE